MIETIEAYGLRVRVPARDTFVGACLKRHGEFAKPELDFLLDHAPAPHGIFLDVGANVGAISLPFAQARPGWSVLSCEASPTLAAMLAESTELNGLGNLQVISAAIGAQAGVAEFPSVELVEYGNYGNLGFHWPDHFPRSEVKIVRLDDVAPADVALVKIDVQGFEAEVLRGARRLIEETRPVWVVEATKEFPAVLSEVISTLSDAGYWLGWFFSPFATPAGGADETARWVGDASIVALPGVENRWRLPAVRGPDDTRPGQASAYPYLSRYGY